MLFNIYLSLYHLSLVLVNSKHILKETKENLLKAEKLLLKTRCFLNSFSQDRPVNGHFPLHQVFNKTISGSHDCSP